MPQNVSTLTTQSFVVKDSGDRMSFASGMVRDTAVGKTDYSKIFTGPMLERYCVHLTKAEVKYPDIAPGVPNFSLASGVEEYVRAKKSLARHHFQLQMGLRDEDHAAACWFNIQVMEMVRMAMDSVDPLICINVDAQKVYGTTTTTT